MVIIIYFAKALSIIGTLLASFYVFMRAVDYRASIGRKALSVLWCLLLALQYAIDPPWIPIPTVYIVQCVLTIIFILLITKMKLDTIISAYLLSYGISYVLYYVSAFLVSSVFGLFASGYLPNDSDFNNPIFLLIYALTVLIQLSLPLLIFRIRRFRRGFPFLLKRYAVIIALILAGALLVFITYSKAFAGVPDAPTVILFIAGILIVGVGTFLWVQRGIKSFKRKWVKSQNEELLQKELDEVNRELRYYKDLYDAVRTANHSTKHRQAALERRVTDIIEKARLTLFAEASEELTAALTDIRKLSDEYNQSVDQVKMNITLPSTNIRAIDDLFALFSSRFAGNEIDFKLKINGSIIHMVDKCIPQNMLETLIGDHLQDAMIAVNAADGGARNILAVLGEVGEYYEFSVHDSGIPFEIDTLVRLGTSHITTHEGQGGSGIGFMTTFETMRQCAASLIIIENPPGGAFSKSVTIRFDGNNEYIIQTHRPNAFPQSDRFCLEY